MAEGAGYPVAAGGLIGELLLEFTQAFLLLAQAFCQLLLLSLQR